MSETIIAEVWRAQQRVGEMGAEAIQRLKDCRRIAYYTRTFCNLRWNLIASLEQRGEVWWVTGGGRMSAREFFMALGLTPQDLGRIYADPRVKHGKKEPYEATTWEEVLESGAFPVWDTATWVRLSQLINKEIGVYYDTLDGTYCQFDYIYLVFPSGEVREIPSEGRGILTV